VTVNKGEAGYMSARETLLRRLVGGVAVTIAVVTGPGAAAKPAMTPPAPATGQVPSQFSPLVPYASFGWLPAGYTAVGQLQTSTSNDSTALYATAKSSTEGSFWLHVMSTGACYQPRRLVISCHWDSGDVTGPLWLTERAPDVNGRPAYWTYGDSLLWQYAPGAWATLLGPGGYNSAPSAADQALTLSVAGGVRYGYQRTPVLFSFWLDEVPAGWQLSTVPFTDAPPYLEALGLDLGPAVKPQAAQLNVAPATKDATCQFVKGLSRYVTVDGVKVIVQGSSSGQSLCVSDLDGLYVWVLLDLRIVGPGTVIPGAAAFGGVVGLVQHLHLLGTQVSGWTTDPLR
jgi:hypothetical protein